MIEGEATVKRYYPEGDRIRFQPANRTCSRSSCARPTSSRRHHRHRGRRVPQALCNAPAIVGATPERWAQQAASAAADMSSALDACCDMRSTSRISRRYRDNRLRVRCVKLRRAVVRRTSMRLDISSDAGSLGHRQRSLSVRAASPLRSRSSRRTRPAPVTPRDVSQARWLWAAVRSRPARGRPARARVPAVTLPRADSRALDGSRQVERTEARLRCCVDRQAVGDPRRCCAARRRAARSSSPAGTQVKLTAVLGDDATFGGYHQLPMRTPRSSCRASAIRSRRCIGGDVVERGRAAATCSTARSRSPPTPTSPPSSARCPRRVDVAFADHDGDRAARSSRSRRRRRPRRSTPRSSRRSRSRSRSRRRRRSVKPPPPIRRRRRRPRRRSSRSRRSRRRRTWRWSRSRTTRTSSRRRPTTRRTSPTRTATSPRRRARRRPTSTRSPRARQVASRESDDTTSAEIGGPDDKIRQLEETEADDRRARRGDRSLAARTRPRKGAIAGRGRRQRRGGHRRQASPACSRCAASSGRGAIVDQRQRRQEGRQARARPASTPSSRSRTTSASWARRRSTRSARSRRARCRARRAAGSRSSTRSRARSRTSSPDVRPGNQTALKTRAHPFALYIARMHRRIHELWGFGFLEDLDDKGADHPLEQSGPVGRTSRCRSTPTARSTRSRLRRPRARPSSTSPRSTP